MRITEIDLQCVEGKSEKLLAYVSVVLDDCFVIRDMKLIFAHGRQILFMPQKKIRIPCPHCGFKNGCDSRFCNDCGKGLPQKAVNGNGTEKARTYVDVAHPITKDFRDSLVNAVIERYQAEVSTSR